MQRPPFSSQLIASLGLLLSFAIITASGCASTARYPTETLRSGEVSVGGGLHGSNHGAIPAATGQVRYGVGRGDLGAHAGVEGYSTKNGSFGVGAIAAGASYRHYFQKWLRVGIESTYHHASQTSAPGDYTDTDQTEFGGPSLVTQSEFVDDRLVGRAVVQLAKNWQRVGVHGGPVAKTGLWIPDSQRPDRNPNTGESIHADWFGLGLGVFGGIAVRNTNGFSVQFDGQFMPLHIARLDTGDYSSADPLSANILRFTLSANYRF